MTNQLTVDPNNAPNGDAILDRFLDWAADSNLELYPHQEEAIISLLGADNVILATPTGSGKSMVALAGAYSQLATGGRTFYTAPIKALVSEKFFEFGRSLGPENVGMITGDASVNPGAPVICCTAEILANRALRLGAAAGVDLAIMDEFHYYSDRDRGWAWQVPLLELPNTQFLLMSATLGDTTDLRLDLERRTGRPSSLVATAQRPVPLDFEYRETTLLDSIEDLLSSAKAPVYIVHFTQRAAAERAQSLTSLDILSSDEKAAIKEAIGGFKFDTPIGKDLKRWVSAGIGLHHAGMLPKYRLLVEKLAQQGLLKLISGTDTLGVGVNVPIRTVLFTQLCKFDGRKVRVLSVRDFQQIAGRAGRKGFDTQGSVWVQAPEHVVENKKAAAKAENDPKKRKKLVKKKPPERGYTHWDADTLDRLVNGTPEPLRSSFSVSHAMMLNVLSRPGDGCEAMKELLVDNHETRKNQRKLIKRSVEIFRSLLDAEIVERLDQPDELGRPIRVNLDLQDDFRLNQPLSLFVVEAVAVLDGEAPDFALQVLSLVESVLDSPEVILRSQLDKAKDALMSEMKSEGVEYDDRIARLDEVEWPKPEREFLEQAFTIFAQHNPWVLGESVKPKAIIRDMYEHAESFNQYVARYGLKRSEGVVLRYLTDGYKTLAQTVPTEYLNPDLNDMIEWLGAVIRRVDSSLIDEWEALVNPSDAQAETEAIVIEDITSNPRAFGVAVRNEVFQWVQLLARRRYGQLIDRLPRGGELDADQIDDSMAPYWQEHEWMGIDGAARASSLVSIDIAAGTVRQILDDPDGNHDWYLEAAIDTNVSKAQDRAVVQLTRIGRY